MEIKVIQSEKLKEKPSNESELGFGQIFTDHMFLIDYDSEKGWYDARIEPYHHLEIDPAAVVFHYGQEIFEGLKAYRCKDDTINLFRPRDNFKRLNRSARRLCMPEIDEDISMEALKKLIAIEKEWVPKTEGTSLYIRPTMIATEAFLGVRPSTKCLYYIIVGPVGSYYKEGLNPVKIFVESKYVRAVVGGMGDAKTGGNYAASLLATEEAKKKGFTQVLWLDACEKKWVEEVGTMNMFFVIDDVAITSPLTGSILGGVTRDAAIKILKNWGITVKEEMISIDDIVSAADSGRLKEAFGTGTAAVISPVGEIAYKDKDYSIAGGKMGELSQRLYNEITGIQYGEKPDTYGWIEKAC